MINIVIPAAGIATRLRPLSSNVSKAMVRINGKPAIDYIIGQAEKLSKIKQIVIVDGQFDDIREYVKSRYENTMDITFVKQPSLKGPRDAIDIGLRQVIHNLPTVVWLGDAIILDDDLPLGTDFLLCKEVTDQSSWCMWDGERYYNKPTTTVENAMALVGLYSFSDGAAAKRAFGGTLGFDISDALELYDKPFERRMTDKWYDIGSLQSYHQTCAELLNQKAREFNTIEYDNDLGLIKKTPDYHCSFSIKTLSGEISWYRALNSKQQAFVPKIFGNGSQLVMSYESGVLLSDLMLYEDIADSTWEFIIDRIFNIKLKYFNNSASYPQYITDFAHSANEMWLKKNKYRLQGEFNDDEKKELLDIAWEVCQQTKPINGMHGDLHFGNIIYNQHTNQFKLIDPRGQYSKWSGTYGDDIYDFAKLAHDLYHGYSALGAGVDKNEVVSEIFVNKLKEYDLPVKPIIDGGLVLLASCIELHSDDPAKQERFKEYVRWTLKNR